MQEAKALVDRPAHPHPKVHFGQVQLAGQARRLRYLM
jgi:hypothetical protein